MYITNIINMIDMNVLLVYLCIYMYQYTTVIIISLNNIVVYRLSHVLYIPVNRLIR